MQNGYAPVLALYPQSDAQGLEITIPHPPQLLPPLQGALAPMTRFVVKARACAVAALDETGERLSRGVPTLDGADYKSNGCEETNVRKTSPRELVLYERRI